MSGRPECNTARRAECPTCKALMFEYCVNTAGDPLHCSHPARVLAAKEAPALTRQRFEMLQLLDEDPTRYIHPSMRTALLRLNLIERSPEPRPTPGHRNYKRPKRSHPLTQAGRAALALARKARADTMFP